MSLVARVNILFLRRAREAEGGPEGGSRGRDTGQYAGISHSWHSCLGLELQNSSVGRTGHPLDERAQLSSPLECVHGEDRDIQEQKLSWCEHLNSAHNKHVSVAPSSSTISNSSARLHFSLYPDK